jgi:hypothetical protein
MKINTLLRMSHKIIFEKIKLKNSEKNDSYFESNIIYVNLNIE